MHPEPRTRAHMTDDARTTVQCTRSSSIPHVFPQGSRRSRSRGGCLPMGHPRRCLRPTGWVACSRGGIRGFFVTPMSSQSLGGSVGRWPRTAAFPDIRAMCGTGVWCVGGRQCCLREWDGRARGSQPLRAGLVTPRGESCALGHEGRCQLTLSPCLHWYRLVAVASGLRYRRRRPAQCSSRMLERRASWRGVLRQHAWGK